MKSFPSCQQFFFSKPHRLTAIVAAALACASIALAGPVHDAARKGDLNKVKALLQSDPKLVSDVDSKGDTPLHVAALHGELAVAQALLDAGADVNVKNHYGAFKRPPPCSRCRWRPSRETGVWLGVGCYCKSEARTALASPPDRKSTRLNSSHLG